MLIIDSIIWATTYPNVLINIWITLQQRETKMCVMSSGIFMFIRIIVWQAETKMSTMSSVEYILRYTQVLLITTLLK